MSELDGERTALDRLSRTMYTAIGIAAAIFGILLSPGPSGSLGQVNQVDKPFLAFSVTVGLVLPASFIVLGRVLSADIMRGFVTSVAIGFVASQLLFPLAMVDDKLAEQGSPWLQGFGPIPATLLAVAWGSRITWIFALTQGPIVFGVSLLTREVSLIQSVLDAMGAMVSCSIFAGVSLSVVLAAARLDEVAKRARGQASIEASAVTREREQARINAMVHDDIMSVLLAASRVPVPPGLADQARGALRSVEALASAELGKGPYSPEDLVAVLRATVSDAAADIEFTYTIESSEAIPQEVVAALSEATEEAIRNSLFHAGSPDVRRGVAVNITGKAVQTIVTDNGKGFSLRDVPQRRLGLRVSILQRMHSLQGGEASVSSRPGQGATITLTWVRP